MSEGVVDVLWWKMSLHAYYHSLTTTGTWEGSEWRICCQVLSSFSFVGHNITKRTKRRIARTCEQEGEHWLHVNLGTHTQSTAKSVENEREILVANEKEEGEGDRGNIFYLLSSNCTLHSIHWVYTVHPKSRQYYTGDGEGRGTQQTEGTIDTTQLNPIFLSHHPFLGQWPEKRRGEEKEHLTKNFTFFFLFFFVFPLSFCTSFVAGKDSFSSSFCLPRPLLLSSSPFSELSFSLSLSPSNLLLHRNSIPLLHPRYTCAWKSSHRHKRQTVTPQASRVPDLSLS